MMQTSKKTGPLIKKMISVLLMATFLISTQTGRNTVVHAASNNLGETISNFVGAWSACEYAIGTGIYTAYLRMNVKEDGSFSIYDAEAGNPGIEGKMSVVDATNIQLECTPDDFDSPWPELQHTDQLEYHFYNDNQVRLTYKDRSIVFSKTGKGFSFNGMFSGNWSSDVNKSWYSNSGLKTSFTYLLRTDGDTILLYRARKGSETLIGSFTGLSYDKKTGVVKTITELEDASKLPKNWRTMKEGRHFQNFKFSYDSSKHCLTLTYKNKSYSFYTNLIYGVSKKSDYYKVMNQNWRCKTSKMDLQMRTYVNKGIRYLTVRDTSSNGELYANATIEVNESKKKIIVKWNKDATQKKFYEKYKSQKSMAYNLKSDGKLLVKYGGKNLTFTKLK